MSATATVAAPAKVNLYLRVVRKRPDGYHELDTFFQAIDLADLVTLEVTRVRGGGVVLEVEGADLGAPEENLAYRAARRLLAAGARREGVRIRLEKRIPVGAGLGGGSSDAAAVMRGLAALLDGLDDGARLQAIAAELGSDVPFFLGASALARGRGRGELLEPLPSLPTAYLVLVAPPVHSSTATAYRELARARLDGASHAVSHAPATPTSWAEVAAAAHNDFQTLIAARHPEVATALSALESAGASVSLLSGSGASAFGIFTDKARAERAALQLRHRLRWPCGAVRTLQSLPTPRLGP